MRVLSASRATTCCSRCESTATKSTTKAACTSRRRCRSTRRCRISISQTPTRCVCVAAQYSGSSEGFQSRVSVTYSYQSLLTTAAFLFARSVRCLLRMVMFIFQRIESLIALSTVLKYNCTLKALNVSRPLLFTHQEETTVHFAETLGVRSCVNAVTNDAKVAFQSCTF